MTDPSKYKFNHSMLRVKDPKASLAFYKHLGMSVVGKWQGHMYISSIPAANLCLSL